MYSDLHFWIGENIMRRTVLLVALVCLPTLGGQTFGELCTIDAVPAATLLLPYFEVSLNSIPDDDVQAERSVDTFFSISNAFGRFHSRPRNALGRLVVAIDRFRYFPDRLRRSDGESQRRVQQR